MAVSLLPEILSLKHGIVVHIRGILVCLNSAKSAVKKAIVGHSAPRSDLATALVVVPVAPPLLVTVYLFIYEPLVDRYRLQGGFSEMSLLPPPGKSTKYCDESVCMSTLLAYLQNRTSKLREIFCIHTDAHDEPIAPPRPLEWTIISVIRWLK